jgi:hypothetical protein
VGNRDVPTADRGRAERAHALVVEARRTSSPFDRFRITIDPIRIDPIVPPIGGEGDRQ